jgi:hypothetical protein
MSLDLAEVSKIKEEKAKKAISKSGLESVVFSCMA